MAVDGISGVRGIVQCAMEIAEEFTNSDKRSIEKEEGLGGVPEACAAAAAAQALVRGGECESVLFGVAFPGEPCAVALPGGGHESD